MRKMTRRGLLGLALATTTTPTFAQGFDYELMDPAERVPRRYSVERFLSLAPNDVYMVNLAIRRGRPITIAGYTPSQTKEIVQLAMKDPAAARARLGR